MKKVPGWRMKEKKEAKKKRAERVILSGLAVFLARMPSK